MPVLSRNFARTHEARQKGGMPAAPHLFESGTHGFGLGGNDDILKTSPDIAIRWMGQRKLMGK